MSASPSAVLFDADGVLQHRSSEWPSDVAKRLPRPAEIERFLADVFALELPALEGRTSFPDALALALERWGWRGNLADALEAWTTIEVREDLTEIVRGVRENGVGVHLATNQEAHKARHMSVNLGYGSLFEREFYSCHLGVAKPSGSFFRAILERLQLEPSDLLLLDDREENVDAASEVGLHACVYEHRDGPRALLDVLARFGIEVP